MKLLRKIHLYLGCFFAPLLVFFAVSGIWQCFFFQYGTGDQKPNENIVLLSTLHTSRGLKGSIHGISSLSSPSTRWFAAIMGVMLIVNMTLGVAMAWRLGHKRGSIVTLLAGILVPAILVWMAVSHSAR